MHGSERHDQVEVLSDGLAGGGGIARVEGCKEAFDGGLGAAHVVWSASEEGVKMTAKVANLALREKQPQIVVFISR